MAFLRLKLAFLSKIIILGDLAIVRNVVRFKKHKICGTVFMIRIGLKRIEKDLKVSDLRSFSQEGERIGL